MLTTLAGSDLLRHSRKLVAFQSDP